MTGNFLIQCKTRKMEVLQFLAVAFGSYVFGIIVMMIIRANTMEENECVTLGMLIAMAALVFMHFFGIIFSFVGEFNMAISMGATRRAYVGSYALFNMAELAGLELLLFVLGKIESALMRVIYPQCEVILDLTQYFQWKYLLAVIVGMTIVELFLGAVILRFGMKAFWAIWAIACGIVAENITVWRSSGSSPRIVSMSSRNPMFSISSASSRTTVWIASVRIVFLLI